MDNTHKLAVYRLMRVRHGIKAKIFLNGTPSIDPDHTIAITIESISSALRVSNTVKGIRDSIQKISSGQDTESLRFRIEFDSVEDPSRRVELELQNFEEFRNWLGDLQVEYQRQADAEPIG